MMKFNGLQYAVLGTLLFYICDAAHIRTNYVDNDEQPARIISGKHFELRPHQDVLEIEPGAAKVELIAYFKGVSQAIYEWSDNHNNRISISLSEEDEDKDEEDTGDFINNVYYTLKNNGTPETNFIKTKKYETYVNSTTVLLTILNPKLGDFGQYTLRVKYLLGHIGCNKEITFQLRVKEKPTVSIEEKFVRPYQLSSISCECNGYPLSDITWTFKPCKMIGDLPACSLDETVDTNVITSVETERLSDTHQISKVNFYTEKSGLIVCKAVNGIGSNTVETHISLEELEDV